METRRLVSTKSENLYNATRKKPSRILAWTALLLVAGLVAGCSSTKPMALKNYKAGKASANPIGIFSLRMENVYKPSFQPKVKTVELMPAGQKKAKVFKVDDAYREGEKQFFEYLVSVELPPGEYTLGPVFGGRGNMLVSGWFKFPVDARFTLPANGVNYLGHVKMVNRERKEGEKRSGGVTPLIDQSVTGFSGGTFDITVEDRSAEDIPAFKQTYPAINGEEIQKVIMQR